MANWGTFMRNEGYTKFEEARHLCEDESKNDPEDEPFNCKYKARDILDELKQTLKKSAENDDSQTLRILIACVNLKLAANYIDTEELSTGEELLNKCLDDIEEIKESEEATNIYQHTLNQLGILWTGRRNNQKALLFLKQAEDLYIHYKHTTGTAPKAFEEYFKDLNEKEETPNFYRETNFENTYIHTLYYMGQVYAKIDEKDKSANCCHIALQRQLKSHVYDPVDWALNAATLSQYYMSCDDFCQSRHCIASAEFVLREDTPPDGQGNEELKEKFQKAQADVSRCWVKYGLGLLESSRDHWMAEDVKSDENKRDGTQIETSQNGNNVVLAPETGHSSSGPDHIASISPISHNTDVQQSAEAVQTLTPSNGVAARSANEENYSKSFPRFELELTDLESQITDKRVHDFEDAKKVFLNIQKWLNLSKEFYAINDYCTDYIELVQDSSKAFTLLSFYELSLERQCKMHKRRIDMLSALLDQLNPQHYLLWCRQLMFEIADIYSHMLDLKLATIESSHLPATPHAIKKVNFLTQESISSYQTYLDSLKGGKTELPDKFSEMDVRPALIAFFCLGRLYSKFLVPDLTQRIEFTRKSLECYKFLVDYCYRFPDAKESVSSEFGVCEDLVALLPAKMEKMRQMSDI